jgi:hypothetical protein
MWVTEPAACGAACAATPTQPDPSLHPTPPPQRGHLLQDQGGAGRVGNVHQRPKV